VVIEQEDQLLGRRVVEALNVAVAASYAHREAVAVS
jgi:hypothetical protein